MEKKQIHTIQNKIAYLGDYLFIMASLLMMILLPIHKMSTTIPLVIYVVSFLFIKKDFKLHGIFYLFMLSISCYFILHVVSYFNSFYKFYAYNDLIKKLPVILIPLIIIFKKNIKPSEFKHIWSTFLFSNLLMLTFIIIRFLYFWLVKDEILSNVNIVNFTIIHPSYLSFYILFSLVILWYETALYSFLTKNYIKVTITLLALFALIILGSRIALFSYFLIISIIAFQYFSWKKRLIVFSFLIFSFSLSIWKVPFLNKRFEKAYNMLSQDASMTNQYTVDDRIMIWKNAKELIVEKPFWGYSIGDYCYHVLKEKHNESGFGKGYRQKLNAHNQLLETWLALGIIGMISYVSIYVILFKIAIQEKMLPFIGFLLLIIIFSSVESIFQSQGGIVFFGVFVGLFIQKAKHI